MNKLYTSALTLLAALLLSACASSVHIRALAPAAVPMPANLQSVATANRIIPESRRDQFFDVLEGAFTGDGLVVLEAFDSDMLMSHTNGFRTYKDKDGKEHQVPTVHVEMVMKIVSGFRTYGAAQGFVLDQARQEDQLVFSGNGDNYGQALRQLPPPEECIRRVAQRAGDGYARRIAPSYIDLNRDYFTSAKKDALMKQAAVRADAEDWKGAEMLWQQAAKNLNPKIAGRAFYNLAVASEVRGDLPGAIDWAKKSAYTCNNGQAKNYLRVLNDRLRAQELVQEQLKSVPVMN